MFPNHSQSHSMLGRLQLVDIARDVVVELRRTPPWYWTVIAFVPQKGCVGLRLPWFNFGIFDLFCTFSKLAHPH